jgi:hypothetical protein
MVAWSWVDHSTISTVLQLNLLQSVAELCVKLAQAGVTPPTVPPQQLSAQTFGQPAFDKHLGTANDGCQQ